MTITERLAEANGAIEPERVQEYKDRLASTHVANNEVLPGPLAEAFSPRQNIKVGPFTVRPMVAGDRVLFKLLDSPFHREALAKSVPTTNGTSEVDMTPEETFELCFQFTRPVSESRAMIEKGREAFRNAAILAIGDLTEVEIAMIINAISEQMKRAVASWLQFSGKPGDGEGTTHFFQEAGGQAKVPSAGISITSAA